MDRLRNIGSGLLLTIGAVAGGAVGGYLGLVTERGLAGLITVGAAIAGIAAGIYIAQLILAAPSDEDS